MLITPSNLQLFFTTWETRLWQSFGATSVWHEKVATTYPMGSEQIAFGWIGMVDAMREWIGPRVTRSPAPETYVVVAQLFELTEQVDKIKLSDDQFGIYAPLASMMGTNMAKLPDFQLRDLIQNLGSQTGALQNGLDGLTQWNTAHPVDIYDPSKGTYSNDFRSGGFTVNGINVGGGLTNNSYATLWNETASRKSQSGEALGLVPDTLMIPPQLKYTAETILHASFFAPGTIGVSPGLTSQVGAAENVLKGSGELFMNQDLAAQPTIWYLLVTQRAGIKPFAWCMRQAPTFIVRNQPQDPVVFDTHNFLMGSDARGAPAWSHAFLSSISGP